MKYMVQIEIDPETGADIEENPQEIMKVTQMWQALKPIDMYFHSSRRAITIIVEAPNEDPLFEALHATWVLTRSYPEISPVVTAEEFPAMLKRVGIGG